MTADRASATRVIEIAGLSCVGKTTLADSIVTAAPPGTRVGMRAGFSAPLRRGAYIALMLREAPRWRALYRLLRRALPGHAARRRLRMYIKHLWRRRQQIRTGGTGRVVEDEAFATWFARDLLRCPGLDDWLAANIDLFYPRRVGRHAGEYVLVTVSCGELLRTQRIHRRRLARGGPAYARREYALYGVFGEKRPALQQVNALLRERGLVVAADDVDRPTRLAREVLADEDIDHLMR